MPFNEYNQKAINDIYKNAHIALQSISDLIPAVDDEGIKNELQEEYEGYEKIIGNISTFMAENGIEPKDVNPFKKAMLCFLKKERKIKSPTHSLSFFDILKFQILIQSGLSKRAKVNDAIHFMAYEIRKRTKQTGSRQRFPPP